MNRPQISVFVVCPAQEYFAHTLSLPVKSCKIKDYSRHLLPLDRKGFYRVTPVVTVGLGFQFNSKDRPYLVHVYLVTTGKGYRQGKRDTAHQLDKAHQLHNFNKWLHRSGQYPRANFLDVRYFANMDNCKSILIIIKPSYRFQTFILNNNNNSFLNFINAHQLNEKRFFFWRDCAVFPFIDIHCNSKPRFLFFLLIDYHIF